LHSLISLWRYILKGSRIC